MARPDWQAAYRGIGEIGTALGERAREKQKRQAAMQDAYQKAIMNEMIKQKFAPQQKWQPTSMVEAIAFEREKARLKKEEVVSPEEKAEEALGILKRFKQPRKEPAWATIPERPELGVTPEMEVPGLGRGRVAGTLPREARGVTPPFMRFPSVEERFEERGFRPTVKKGKVEIEAIKPEKLPTPPTRLQMVNLARNLAGKIQDKETDIEYANRVQSWIPIAERMLKEPEPRKEIPGREPPKTKEKIIEELKTLRAKGASLSDLYTYLQYEGYTEPIKRTLEQTLPFGAGAPIRAGRALGEAFERFRR